MVVCVGVSNNTIGSIPDQERNGGYGQISREVGKRDNLGRSRDGLWERGDLKMRKDQEGGGLLVDGLMGRRAVGDRSREAELSGAGGWQGMVGIGLRVAGSGRLREADGRGWSAEGGGRQGVVG
jgi:hypothetical protein